MAIPSQTATRRARSTRWAPARPGIPAFAPSPVYRPRRPTETPLYPVVQHHLETFLAEAEQPDGRGVPPWVEHDFRRYLTCGILTHGFARLRCDACAQERLLAFSCKGRGVCPSCTTRRMAEVAAHLTDHVIPHVPARQWVLSLPKRLRPYLTHDPALVGRILGVLLRIILGALREAAPDAPPDAALGAVSFLHRFGSSLNPHLHLHLVVLDGLFARDTEGSLAFHRARGLDADAARALTPLVQDRVLRLFVRRRLLDPHEAADMRTWRGTGGFSLDGSVRVEAHDRAGLERLIRGHRREALVVPGPPSRCIASTPPPASPPCAGPTPA